MFIKVLQDIINYLNIVSVTSKFYDSLKNLISDVIRNTFHFRSFILVNGNQVKSIIFHDHERSFKKFTLKDIFNNCCVLYFTLKTMVLDA